MLAPALKAQYRVFPILRYFSKNSKRQFTPRILRDPRLTNQGYLPNPRKSYEYDLTDVPNAHLYYDRSTQRTVENKAYRAKRAAKRNEIPMTETSYNMIIEDLQNKAIVARASDKIFLRIKQLETLHPDKEISYTKYLDSYFRNLNRGHFNKFKIRGISMLLSYTLKYSRMEKESFEMLFNYVTGLTLNTFYQKSNLSEEVKKEQAYVTSLDRLILLLKRDIEEHQEAWDIVDRQGKRLFEAVEKEVDQFLSAENLLRFGRFLANVPQIDALSEVYTAEFIKVAGNNKKDTICALLTLEIDAKFSFLPDKLVNELLSNILSAKKLTIQATLDLCNILTSHKGLEKRQDAHKKIHDDLEKTLRSARLSNNDTESLIALYRIAKSASVSDADLSILRNILKRRAEEIKTKVDIIRGHSLLLFYLTEGIDVPQSLYNGLETTLRTAPVQRMKLSVLNSLKNTLQNLNTPQSQQLILDVDYLISGGKETSQLYPNLERLVEQL